jgi:hypothetical protein
MARGPLEATAFLGGGCGGVFLLDLGSLMVAVVVCEEKVLVV